MKVVETRPFIVVLNCSIVRTWQRLYFCFPKQNAYLYIKIDFLVSACSNEWYFQMNSSASHWISQCCLVLAWPKLISDYIEHLPNSFYHFIEENYITIIFIVLSPSLSTLPLLHCSLHLSHLRLMLQHALFTSEYPLVNFCGWLQGIKHRNLTFPTVAYSSYLDLHKGSIASTFQSIQPFLH